MIIPRGGVIISATGANRATTLRKGGTIHVTFCAEYTVWYVSHCLPQSQRAETLTQVQLTYHLNLVSHTPYRMSHERQSAQLMAFWLQGLSLPSPDIELSVDRAGRKNDKGYESVRFMAFIVGHVLLTVGRMSTLMTNHPARRNQN